MGGGDERGVVVPAEPGAAFEVVERETGFQFAVVVLDAPPDFGDRDEFLQRCRLRQGGEPVVGGCGCAFGPFGEQPLGGEGTVGFPSYRGGIALRRFGGGYTTEV